MSNLNIKGDCHKFMAKKQKPTKIKIDIEERDENENSAGDVSDTWKGNFILDKNTDQQLIDYLEQPGDKNQQIVNLLNLGRAVFLAATFSTSGDALRELLRPLDERIESLNTTIETFQGKSKGASAIGTMGEDIAKNQFSERFNAIGDAFEIDSNTDHQGDILGEMKIKTDTGVEMVPVLIEAKEYKTPPGSEQIDKFWSDMEENKQKYGMMISFKQRIATKKDAIDIETRGGKVVFFVSNNSHHDRRHIVAWEMLRMIIKTDLVTGMIGKGVSRQVETMIQNLNVEISQLEDAEGHLGKIKRTAENIISSAGEHSQELYFASAEIRSTISNCIRRMKFLISNAGEEYAVAAKQLLEWKENVMDRAFEHFTKDQKMLITVIEHPIQKNRDNVDIGMSDDGKEVTLKSLTFQDRNVTFISQATNLVIDFDLPLKQELLGVMGTSTVKNKQRLSIKPVKKNYATLPFNEIRQSLELLFNDPVVGGEAVNDTDNEPKSDDVEHGAEEGVAETEAAEIDYSSMKHVELKALCKKAGKPVGGKKEDLIARLTK